MDARRTGRHVAVAALLGSLWSTVARADVDVTVDATADVHPISPLIYGINFPSDAHFGTKAITVVRRGGNATSRYNYELDVHNTGADWFFENIFDCNGCGNAKDNSSANAFLKQAADHDLVALFTIPTIGWKPHDTVPGGQNHACGCPKSVTANQECFDQWDSACGDGRTGGNCNQKGNTWVTCAAASVTSDAADPAYEKGWVAYLASKFGPAGSQRIYELDNEPALWSSTHHDVRPERLGYDELWQRMRDYAVATVEADSTAQLAGPVEWGWPNYFCSDKDVVSNGCNANSPDRKAHGGTELVAWLLDQAKAYENANGKRILHYLDLHYYPQGGSPPENLRSLWDASYTDPSWINDKIRLIPRMRDWVSQHYPGTKISISEYDFYDHDSATGAVTYAEALGIFGREALDMATAWAPPDANQRSFAAFKLFRNFDGAGGAFENVGIRASVTGNGVKAYAATGAKRLTVVLVNETGSPVTAHVSVGGFTTGAGALYSNDSGASITKKNDVTFASGSASVTLPATSISMLVSDGDNPNPLPDAGSGSGSGGTTSSNGGTTSSNGGTTSSSGGVTNGGGTSSGSGSSTGASGGGATSAGGSATNAGGTASGAGGSAAGGPGSGAGGTTIGSTDEPLTGAAPSGDSGGCGCHVTSQDASGRSLALLGALAALGAMRRRRLPR